MDFDRPREILVESLKFQIKDKRVLEAFSRVPREFFVPPELQALAYEDKPLAIGHGQTISQPYIVALMIQSLELKGQEKILEIGTGSGYQAALLAELVKTVYSVERIHELAEAAKELLARLDYKNINIGIAGDELGWKEHAPYDGIIVAAAAPAVPQSLLEQLAVGGIMIIPVGSRWEQELIKVRKGPHGNQIENLGGCRFVPLIGKDAWQE
ncbi:MAG: protein-L-isoaspartate(D-aspartate) O-methyltransferase [Dehalococcoidia bacterium]